MYVISKLLTMTKLGYTWYPENWWTSEAFFEWEDYPLVRYAYREILDLLYSKKGNVKITQSILKSRFRIDLSLEEFEMLKSKFDVDDKGYWSSEKVKIRLTKAESARENGQKGGRPRGSKNTSNSSDEKTQKPKKKTQKENPKNPPLERERESEIEIKSKSEIENKELDAYDFLKNECQEKIEIFEMQNKKSFQDFDVFVKNFNSKVILEKIPYEPDLLYARLMQLNTNWDKSKIETTNQNQQKVSKRNYF